MLQTNIKLTQIMILDFNFEVILLVMEDTLKMSFILTPLGSGQFIYFWAGDLQTSSPQPS